ncbi:conserved hypothetical protein [Candida dubliniensis CD36]|uniref:Uncharacterized protein n=1 Tax=Candida dubliniensis (strain CD36 / ATCC MYA-646 / CBS 7987 / NCPF 3949 / NRRL Y-17841) TaxID=573826 RepID=B9WMP1_CANDC|nr:conserved hypothetical protein [Candida dubliniensis CD36]CAX40356.1 conserved hypothetical protein [Candida dubliniensis CD36]
MISTAKRSVLLCSSHSTCPLIIYRMQSTVPLSSNDLYISRIRAIASKREDDLKLHSSTFEPIPTFLRSRVKRDLVGRINLREKMNEEDKRYLKQKMSSLQSYLKLDFNTDELICIAYGSTNMELKLKNSIMETDTLRELGKSRFKLSLLKNTIFIDDRYLTATPLELSSDLDVFNNEDILYEFLKVNQLHRHSLLNRELLINIQLPRKEYVMKRHMLWRQAAIGSFYTMLGIVMVKYHNGKILDKLITDKIINGKRGVIKIVQRNL